MVGWLAEPAVDPPAIVARDYEGPLGVEGPARDVDDVEPARRGSRPKLQPPPVTEPSAYDREAPRFDTAAQWRAWAKGERAELKAEKAGLQSQRKATRNPDLVNERIRLRTRRDLLTAAIHRAERAGRTEDAERSRTELARIELRLIEVEQETMERDDLKRRLHANRIALGKTRNFKIFPVIGPAYTPELGFLVAGGALMSWSSQPHNPDLPRSSFPFTIGYTSTHAVVANGKLTSFWLDDWLRVYADLWLKDMADNYWGVGYDAARYPSAPDDTTSYQRLWWWINPKILGRLVVPGLYGGLNVDVNFTGADDVSPEMAADPTFVEFGADNFNSGIGPVLQYDTRDVPQNAWRGIFAQVMFTAYGAYLGGQNAYQVLDIDYRHYIPIVREGSSLALQVRSRMGFGDNPWGEMAFLGSPFDLRGYQWGRYRDKSMLFGLAEYRFTFNRIRPAPDGRLLSRHGFVVWVGAGTLGEDITEWTKWLPNGGAGYRLELQPRMNLRLDVGVGNDSFAFYFNFNEAF